MTSFLPEPSLLKRLLNNFRFCILVAIPKYQAAKIVGTVIPNVKIVKTILNQNLIKGPW